MGKPKVSGGTISFTYTETASWATAGTFGSPAGMYKDIVITGCQVGDLLLVFGLCENNNGDPTAREFTTQTGTAGRTAIWDMVVPAIVTQNDVCATAAYALITTAGTTTVRVRVDAVSSSNHMGAGAFLIPASKVGATYGFIGTGFNNDIDGQTSATLSSNSLVIYAAGDWEAANPGNTPTPSTNATIHRSLLDSSAYGVFVASWQNQAAGTRNYGPSGLTSRDFSGVVFRMDM